MRVAILYHPKSEHGGVVEDYSHDFERHSPGKKLELVSLETVEGAELAKLYDAVRYPAVLAIADDGHLLHIWQEESLPLMRDLDYYFQD